MGHKTHAEVAEKVDAAINDAADRIKELYEFALIHPLTYSSPVQFREDVYTIIKNHSYGDKPFIDPHPDKKERENGIERIPAEGSQHRDRLCDVAAG